MGKFSHPIEGLAKTEAGEYWNASDFLSVSVFSLSDTSENLRKSNKNISRSIFLSLRAFEEQIYATLIYQF